MSKNLLRNRNNSIPTIKQHALIIQEIYSYRQFTEKAILEYLEKWVYDGSWYSTERDSMLADRFLNKCINEKILLPGITTFERFLSRIMDNVSKDIEQKIIHSIDGMDLTRVNDLTTLSTINKTGLLMTKLDSLKEPLKEPSYSEIKRGFERIQEFDSFSVDSWGFSSVPKGKLKLFAEYTAKAKSQSIQRMPEKKRLAYLISFIYEYRVIAMDELLLALASGFFLVKRNKKEQA